MGGCPTPIGPPAQRLPLGAAAALRATSGAVLAAVECDVDEVARAAIALMGAVLGGILAVAGANGTVTALVSEGVSEPSIPPVRLAVILTMAGVAGVVAAAAPARKASRLDVLDAIARH